MSRSLVYAVPTLAALALAATAACAVDVRGINGPPEVGTDYYLGVVDGQARLVKASETACDWEFVREKDGTLLRVNSGRSTKWEGLYLGYDPQGKDKAVILLEKPGPTTYWGVGKNSVLGKEPYTHAFGVKGGKLAGHILSVGDKAEELKDRQGRPFTAYRVVLSPNPKPIPRFYVFEIAP
jgi:hypothetical protein